MKIVRYIKMAIAALLLAITAICVTQSWRLGTAWAARRRVLAIQLAETAGSLRESGDANIALSLLLAIESGRLHPTPTGDRAIRSAIALLRVPLSSQKATDMAKGVPPLALSSGGELEVRWENGTLHIIETRNRKLQTSLPFNTPISSVYFSKDSKLLAAVDINRVTHVREIVSGHDLGSFEISADVIRKYSGLNTILGAQIAHDKFAQNVFKISPTTNVASANHPEDLRHDDVDFLEFSADNRVMVISSRHGLCIFDLAAKSERCLPYKSPGLLAFAPMSSTLLIASSQNMVLVPLDNSDKIHGFFSMCGDVRTISFSPGAGTIAYGSDCGAYLADLRTGRQHTLDHHAQVTHLRFNRDGSLLLTTGTDNSVRVFDTTSHGLLAKLNHSSEVGAAEFSPDSQLLITATNDGVARLFEWKREAEVGQILLDGPTTSIIIDQDPIRGPIAALINWHNKVERVPLYDSRAVSLKDEAGSLQVALLGQQSAEFSPDGLTLVLADNKALSYFDVASGALMHSVSLSKQTRVRGLSVSERAQMAALIDSGTAMLLRDNKRLESIDSPSDVKQSALKITLSSTGGLVALASSSGLSEDVSNVKVLDVRKSRLPWLFSCGGEPRALAISPDDATIMVGTSEGKVCIGDLRTRESIQEPYSSDPVTAIAIDKRSGIIAVGTETGKVYFGSRDRVGHGMKSFFLREIAGIKNKFRKVFSWEPPSLGSSITSITFAEHGDTVVVSTKGQTLHVIEAASGKEITKFNVQGLKTFIVTSNRIKALIAYGQAPYIVSYPMTLKDLIDEACQYGERRDLTDVERKVFGLDNFLYVTPCPSKL